MRHTLSLLALTLFACNDPEEEALQADLAAQEQQLSELTSEVEALRDQLQTLDQLVGNGEDGLTELLTSLRTDVDANGASITGLDTDLSAAETRLDAHQLALDGLSSADGALDARLSAVEADYLTATEGAVLRASGVANAQAIATIDADYLTSADRDLLQQGAATNAAAIAANGSAIAANAAAITTNGDAIGANAAAITADGDAIGANAAAITANGDAIDANAGAITANGATLTAHAASIATLDAGLGEVAADYLTSADRTALQTTLDEHTRWIEGVAADYLPDLDALFTYLATDTDTDTLSLTGASLAVDGEVQSETLRLEGNSLHFLQCAGGGYSCTPKQCLDLCRSRGERMATTDQVFAGASRGYEACAHMWMLDPGNPANVTLAYPMFHNTTSSGCGPTNTGEVPRLVVSGAYPWNSASTYNCACSSM
ncbi:MAG: hypothetical protein JXX28_12585 [Deltaproteobacteria bacterium]|nr:hypothetical protein [Deltaproteobacteria bacterium]